MAVPIIAAEAAPEVAAGFSASSLLGPMGHLATGLTLSNKIFDQGKKLGSTLFKGAKAIGRGISNLFGGRHHHHTHNHYHITNVRPPPPPPNGIERPPPRSDDSSGGGAPMP